MDLGGAMDNTSERQRLAAAALFFWLLSLFEGKVELQSL